MVQEIAVELLIIARLVKRFDFEVHANVVELGDTLSFDLIVKHCKLF